MAITIDNAYVQTFEDNVRHLAQQEQSKLLGHCHVVHKNSESHRFDRLASVSASAKSSARTASPTSDAAWSGRKTTIATYHVGETVEPEDIVQMLIEPRSPLVRAMVMAVNRQIDDVIIADAIGSATDQDGGSVAFTAGQTIGDGTGEIDLDFVLEVDEVFYDNDVDPDLPKCFVIGPKQRRKLLQLMEVTSGDFQNGKALADGSLPNWMGYDWVVSTRLNVPSADELDCIVMTNQAMGVHFANDIWTRVAERPDLSFAWQLYAAVSLDSVRIHDEHLVKAHVADTIS